VDHDWRGTGKSDFIQLNTILRSLFRRNRREYRRGERQGKSLLSMMVGYHNRMSLGVGLRDFEENRKKPTHKQNRTRWLRQDLN
jgi:hypothetical protein